MSAQRIIPISVTYDGNAGEFIFEPGTEYSPTDLFPNFKNVMPGDTITQKITVRNDPAKKCTAKIYMRSLGAEQGSENFLSQLNLTVSLAEGDKTFFKAPSDRKDGLAEWRCLGTFEPGADVTLDVTLEVPIELGNEFQNSVGYLDWQFRVEEFDAPKTGDEIVIWPYITGLSVCTVLLAVLLIVKKRRQKED